MKVALSSPVPGFQKELYDVLYIFLETIHKAPEGDASADLVVDISETTRNGIRHCAARLSGSLSGEASGSAAVSGDLLEEKRRHKRLQKTALFDALVMATGRRPPWGSLTGIRPTRLVYELMDSGNTLPAALGWVWDVFRLSAEKAELLSEIVSVQQSLPKPQAGEIACYIGIPFCASRCRYCSFLSREAGRGTLLQPYTEALVREIDGTVQLMRERGLKARSVYVGGGTPTVLSEAQLVQVMTAAGPLIETAAEVTLEAGRPDTITPGKLAVIKALGAGRVSVNPQSMHDSTLQAIGRRHTAEQVRGAVSQAREAGFGHLNMDVIAGLPGENLMMFEQTMDGVLRLSPESVTVHTLSVKRSSDMYRYGDPLPDGEEVSRMVTHAREVLRGLGYEPYYLYRQKHMAGNQENIGYAKPGYACLYNIDMMEDRTTVLAMGAGSVSKLVGPGSGSILRGPNVKDIDQYLLRVDEMLARKKALFEGFGKGVRAPLQQAESDPED